MLYLKLRKWIAIFVIITFTFQVEILLYCQSEDEIVKQFHKAKESFRDGRYINTRTRLERIMGIIHQQKIDRKDILGQCCLLLGAFYEKEGKPVLAKEYYRKAKETYGILLVEGVDLESLPLYRKLVKGEENTKGTIQKEGRKKKKRFPWQLAAGGVAAAAAVYFLIIKPKKRYRLTVYLGDGVEGTPPEGVHNYKKGWKVSYKYKARDGYSTPIVMLDEKEIPVSGVIEMKGNCTLTAAAAANNVYFETDKTGIQVPEGGEADFKVWLSAQPKSDVHATVSHNGGDPDIQVKSGGSLTFTTSNWDIPQIVTLRAAEDNDSQNDQAEFQIAAEGIPGKTVLAAEQDNDILDISITSPQDGEIVSGKVLIKAAASGENQVTKVEFYINETIEKTDTSSPYKFVWDTTEVADGPYTIKARAYDTAGETAETAISLKVKNGPSYMLTVTKGEGVDGTPGSGTTEYRQGDSVFYNYTLKPGYRDLVVKLDGITAADSGTIVMNKHHTLTPTAKPLDRYVLTVEKGEGVEGTPESGTTDYNEGESVSYDYRLQTGYIELVVTLDEATAPPNGTILMNGDHTLTARAKKMSLETDTEAVEICEGNTKTFNVWLSAKPLNKIEVTVSPVNGGDVDIQVLTGERLIFNSSNWDSPQPVTLQAAVDDDHDHGQAVIRIQAPGLHPKEITAVEHDLANDDPPGIWITSPQNGDAVSGKVLIEALANDDYGVKKVEFYIDGELKYTDSGPRYDCTWNTEDVDTGSHSIKVIAYDACDQTGEHEITVTVKDDPPSVEIITPLQSPLSGRVSITVKAEDDNGVQKVMLYVGETLLPAWNEGPETLVTVNFELVTTQFANGDYTLKVVAVDKAGQESEAVKVPITIQN